MNRRIVMLAVLAVFAAAIYAQRVAETVQVTVVEVPVTVVDRDGNSVRGLTKENFEITDDGKKVPIEYFEVVDLPAITAAASQQQQETPLPPSATRHFLLMFDLANSSPGTINRASAAAKDFVDSQLGDRDLAAVATFTSEKGARMITNFTRNRNLLVNAIETLGHPSYFKVADPLMISAVRNTAMADVGTGGGEGKAGVQAVEAEMARESQVVESRTRDGEMRDRLRIQLTNMGSVARTLDRLTGQKQIILLSEGFDATLITGREDLGSSEAKAENNDVLTGEVWNVDSEKRFGSASGNRDIEQMAELFRRSDVVLHAIDIKGLRGSTDASSMSGGSKGKSFESLFLLTRPTGGTVFKNGNDLRDNFAKLMKQQEVVYLLGFQAKAGNRGKFHALKVKTVNARGRVTARAGYYEPAGLTEMERVFTLADILMTDAPIDDIDVKLTAVPLPGPKGYARVPVMVELAGPKLLQNLTGKTATAQLYVYAFDKDSKVVDHLQEKIALDLTKAGDTVRAGGVRYFATLHLPPGDYAVKSVVRVDESGLVGFKRNDLSVPAFDKATVVPPVLFTEPGTWAMIVGPSRGDDYAYPFAAGESKYVPKRNPEMVSAGEYTVALFMAGVPTENLSVAPSLVTANGGTQPANIQLIGRTSTDENGLYKLLFRFKPASIAAGQHELRFDVKTKDGTQSSVTLPFIIQ
jgi:VWFA-related protein